MGPVKRFSPTVSVCKKDDRTEGKCSVKERKVNRQTDGKKLIDDLCLVEEMRVSRVERTPGGLLDV